MKENFMLESIIKEARELDEQCEKIESKIDLTMKKEGYISIDRVNKLNEKLIRLKNQSFKLYEIIGKLSSLTDEKSDIELHNRYEEMERKAMKGRCASDFREEVAEHFRDALKDGKGNITLEEFLNEIEEWFKDWY